MYVFLYLKIKEAAIFDPIEHDNSCSDMKKKKAKKKINHNWKMNIFTSSGNIN